ncbi:MAG: glycosyltransferase [bacterium]|nr:glycosyltransferase [bacterium]
MKRLLMLTMAAPRPSQPLLGIFHAFQAAALRDQGVEMTLFSPGPTAVGLAGVLSRRARRHAERPLRYRIRDVDVHAPRVPFAFPPSVRFGLARRCPGLVDRWARLAMRRAVARVVDEARPEGIVVHGALPWAGLAQAVANRHGIPWCVIEHSAADVMRLRPGSVLTAHYGRMTRGARAVFAVGPRMVDHLQNVARIPHAGLLINGTTPTAGAARETARPPELEGRCVILAAANYYRRKGLEELVRAFSMIAARPDLSHAELHLVVDPPLTLRQLIDRTGLADRIVLHAPMAPATLRQWMVWADVFALPSWSEAFGLVYAEALASGTPVVMSEDCGFGDCLSAVGRSVDDIGWAVPPRDVQALAGVLGAVAAAGHEPRVRGHRGREVVETEFSWHRNARQLIEVFAR